MGLRSGRAVEAVATHFASYVSLRTMEIMPRITIEPGKMGGRPCIRGMRITVSTIMGLLAAKRTREEVLDMYPYLEDEDITAALNFATLLANDQDLPIERA